jgi:chemotaxis protein MotA
MSINFRFLLAAILSILTLFYGVFQTGIDKSLYLNLHAIILVFGGTLCVFLLSNSFERIKSIFKLILNVISIDFNYSREFLIYRLYFISNVVTPGQPKQNIHTSMDHPFIGEIVELIQLDKAEEGNFIEIANKRLEAISHSYFEDAETLSALAKYPPAMGLIGATSGIISMMASIGSGDKASLGYAMASALVATLWGIVVANFIILPLADLTNRMNANNIENRKMILEALLLIKKNKSPSLILELLVSYLPFESREKISSDCVSWYNKYRKKTS